MKLCCSILHRMKRKNVVVMFFIFGFYRLWLQLNFLPNPNGISEPEWSSHFRISGRFVPSRKRSLAIVGGSGFIGADLQKYFNKRGINVTVYDQSYESKHDESTKVHSSEISHAEIQRYRTIIFLGGCAREASCAKLETSERHKLQVQDLLDIVHKMGSSQHLVTVSTGAVLEGHEEAKESTKPINYGRLDAFAKSMYDREAALRALKNLKAPKLTILRLGRVVGISSSQETDTLVPNFFWEAYTRGTLSVQNFHRMQSFLWLEDLCRSFEKVVTSFNDSDESSQGLELWHLSSFNARNLKIASTIASITGAKLNLSGVSTQPGLWEEDIDFKGFSMNTQHFQNAFQFDFKGSLDKVILEFDSHVPRSIATEGDMDFFAEKDRIRDELRLLWIAGEVEKTMLAGATIGIFCSSNEAGKEGFQNTIIRLYEYKRNSFGPNFFNCTSYSRKKEQKSQISGFLFPSSLSIEFAESSLDLQVSIVVPSSAYLNEAALALSMSSSRPDKIVNFIVLDRTPKLVRCYVATGKQELLKSFNYNPTQIPNFIRDETRKKVKLYCHIRNENMLIPFYIIQHAHMFDEAVFLDFLSDDGTIKLITDYAPNSWKVVNSTTGLVFDIVETDKQLQKFERSSPDSWAVVLNVPELFVHPNLRFHLFRLNQDQPGMHILQLQRLTIVGNDTIPLEYFSSLPKQRHVFDEVFSNRYMHYGAKSTYAYKTGRHRLVLVNGTHCVPKCFFPTYQGGFVMGYEWTPWPEIATRKLSVGTNFPKDDIDNRRGFHHTKRMQGGKKFLEEERKQHLIAPLHSLCNFNGDARFLNYRRIFAEEFETAC